MKKDQLKYYIIIFIGLLLIAGEFVYNRFFSEDILTISQIDPMINIIPGNQLKNSNDTIRVARGENAVLQIAITSESEITNLDGKIKSLKFIKDSESEKTMIGWITNVRSSHIYNPISPDHLSSSTGYFPDPILTDTVIDLKKGQTGILCVDIPINNDVDPGFYNGKLNITGLTDGNKISQDFKFTIQVYPVTLPEQSLLVTNWFFPDKFPYMNNGEDVVDDSPEYWECMKEFVDIASTHGQNVWLLYETGNVIVSNDGKDMSFNFDRMDKSIDFFLKNSNTALIEANHFAKRSHNRWTDPFWAEIPVLDGKGGYSNMRLPYDDPRVAKYINSYFPALQEHLRSKSLNDGTGRTWLDIYTQHIADEPLNENKESWEGLARFVKNAAPEIKIIEAYRAEKYDPKLIDILVPQLDEFAYDNYRDIPSSHSCWFYTCMYPRGNFANRYVTLPLIKTRLLHWINFKYDSPGYLHWGFNSWGANEDPFNDVSAPANDWPGGDSHIVYPGFRKMYPSIRLLAMRDGIRDFELLKMVKSVNPDLAQGFANSLVHDFDKYDTSIKEFRSIRRQILETLSVGKQ